MSDRRRAERRGHSSESIAALWLRLKGYRILERRLKTRLGEIDLVAGAPLRPGCFIEVKGRGPGAGAAEAVSRTQQARIARAASLYLSARPTLARRGARFDIIAVTP